MYFSYLTILAVAFSELASAAPTKLNGTHFSVPQISKGSSSSAHTQLSNAKGSVAATPEAYDMTYLSPVTIGGQTFNLNFDTGSADLWVYSNLQSQTQQSGHTIYNASRTGKVMNGQTFAITYGDGSSATGKVYADKVTVGGVTATSQAVEAATSVSDFLLEDPDLDGILGLAFSNVNQVKPSQQKTFFDSVKSSLASKLFTVTLKKGAAGSYDFGYIDNTKYTGKITYTSVNSGSGLWQFGVTGYSLGSGKTASKSFQAIADTATTLLYLPDDVVAAYYAQVKGAQFSSTQGAWVFPCSATLPSFSAVIGGAKATVPGSYLNYAPLDGTTCFGGIQSDSGIGFSIFGSMFLKSQFVVFDQTKSNPRLGFAQQK
ncbi:hypothetical protein H2203_001557 [Taxawa tesnikishii (nom. ined.)]|nr:hypothetical protein H2203_001557 [Dothideales sp. JES 119]